MRSKAQDQSTDDPSCCSCFSSARAPTQTHVLLDQSQEVGPTDGFFGTTGTATSMLLSSLILLSGVTQAHPATGPTIAHYSVLEQLRSEPNYPVTYWILGLSLGKTSCYEEAITEGEKAVKLPSGSPLMQAALAYNFGNAGRTKDACQTLEHLTELAKKKYGAPYFFAGIYIGLGENDRAIECLEKAYEERSHWLLYLYIDPSMDGLRDNPRFQDLLRRVSLPSLTAAICA
jgi:tetratricopeptide (TPR) repeat protein